MVDFLPERPLLGTQRIVHGFASERQVLPGADIPATDTEWLELVGICRSRSSMASRPQSLTVLTFVGACAGSRKRSLVQIESDHRFRAARGRCLAIGLSGEAVNPAYQLHATVITLPEFGL